MKVTIKKGIAKGIVDAPPSKSMAHRMLICAGLANGTSIVHGISQSEDVKATIDCLESLGAKCTIDGDTVTVKGVDVANMDSSQILYCRESGSTMRFFVPICLLSKNQMMLKGATSLLKRPMDVYRDLCKENGLLFSQDTDSLVVKGPLKSNTYKVQGNISSQFISGLIFALPLLDKDSVIDIIPPIESKSYIDLTISALELFGVKATGKNETVIEIKGNQHYQPTEVDVEADYSNAAFFGALNVVGGDIQINGLRKESLQGDKVYEKYFANLEKGTPNIHIANCPDLGPVLFGVASAKYGGIFTGTARLRMKESDRVQAMADELKKFGTSITIHDDSVIIYPHEFHAPDSVLEGHNDHRIVMTMAVLCTLTGGQIDGAEAVRKSFPDFFDKLRSLGIEVEIDEA